MPYTQSVTFAASSTLDAEDMETNLSVVREYVNGQSASVFGGSRINISDIGYGVIETRHLRQPEFRKFGSLFDMTCPTGGMFAVKQNTPLLVSHNQYNYNESGGAVGNDDHNWPMTFNGCMSRLVHRNITPGTPVPERFLPVPKMARSFYLDYKADIFIQWNIKFVVPSDQANPSGTEQDFALFIDDTYYEVTTGTIPGPSYADPNRFDSYARHVSGCKMLKSVEPGWHHVWLASAVDCAICFIGSSKIIIEAETDLS